MRRTFFAAAALLLLLPPAPGQAQERDQVTLRSLIQKEVQVVNDKGEKETRLVEVGNAVPGDELLFTVHYTNAGTRPAENVVVINPVPDHMVYIEGSAAGEGTMATFSVDGGKTYGSPGDLTVTEVDGRTRAATAADYTHIRWAREGDLPAGGSGKVLFRARLR